MFITHSSSGEAAITVCSAHAVATVTAAAVTAAVVLGFTAEPLSV
jgi:hypothetical protein